jgi:hypothetical protein
VKNYYRTGGSIKFLKIPLTETNGFFKLKNKIRTRVRGFLEVKIGYHWFVSVTCKWFRTYTLCKYKYHNEIYLHSI